MIKTFSAFCLMALLFSCNNKTVSNTAMAADGFSTTFENRFLDAYWQEHSFFSIIMAYNQALQKPYVANSSAVKD